MDPSIQPSADNDEPQWRFWHGLMMAALALPGVKVDRAAFLRSQLRPRCTSEVLEKAIQERPAVAGICKEIVDQLADSCIRRHLIEVASISFLTGLPGGWWIGATIPADMAQFYWHAVVLSQKLAYLYGWPDLFEQDDPADDEMIVLLTLFIGVMMGAQAANRVLADVAKRLADQVVHRLPRYALTKYGIYTVAKQVGKWIGVQITKGSFARAISRVVPIVGGVVSASVSVAMMRPMARRLKAHLRTLEYATSDDGGKGPV